MKLQSRSGRKEREWEWGPRGGGKMKGEEEETPKEYVGRKDDASNNGTAPPYLLFSPQLFGSSSRPRTH